MKLRIMYMEKNVKWTAFDIKTGGLIEKTYPLENWYISFSLQTPFSPNSIDSLCEALVKEILDYENNLLHGTDPRVVDCHQLCDWVWLEDEEGKILRHIPGDKENVYQATLVKYAKFLTKEGEAI